MKYVIPVAIDHETAVRLLDGAIPAAATATRAKLAGALEKILAEYRVPKTPPVVEPVEVEETPVETKKNSRRKKDAK